MNFYNPRRLNRKRFGGNTMFNDYWILKQMELLDKETFFKLAKKLDFNIPLLEREWEKKHSNI